MFPGHADRCSNMGAVCTRDFLLDHRETHIENQGSGYYRHMQGKTLVALSNEPPTTGGADGRSVLDPGPQENVTEFGHLVLTGGYGSDNLVPVTQNPSQNQGIDLRQALAQAQGSLQLLLPRIETLQRSADALDVGEEVLTQLKEQGPLGMVLERMLFAQRTQLDAMLAEGMKEKESYETAIPRIKEMLDQRIRPALVIPNGGKA